MGIFFNTKLQNFPIAAFSLKIFKSNNKYRRGKKALDFLLQISDLKISKKLIEQRTRVKFVGSKKECAFI